MARGPAPRDPRHRLMEKVSPEPTSGCWLWSGNVNSNGYGVIGVGSRTDGSRGNELTHRLSYKLNTGEIPVRKMVCHRCDNPSCVNPDHLFLGTQSDNMKDCKSKGRSRGAPKRDICGRCGREKSGNNLYIVSTRARPNQTRCRHCSRAASKRHYDRSKQGRPR